MTKDQKSTILTIVLILVLLLNLAAVSAITGSMGNARMILRPEVDGSTIVTIEKYIKVKNVNDVPINVTLETDDDGAEFIELIDSFVGLEPGEEYKAKFLVEVQDPGTYEGRINVFFTPADGEGAGVALSSTIIVVAAGEDEEPNPEPEEEEEDDEEDDSESNNDEKDDKEDYEEEEITNYDVESEEGDETEATVTPITGASVGATEQGKGLRFLSISTVSLFLVLGYLFFILKEGESELKQKSGAKEES
ncbi:MAG: hypothetical protein ABIB79_00030 [archaeon]